MDTNAIAKRSNELLEQVVKGTSFESKPLFQQDLQGFETALIALANSDVGKVFAERISTLVTHISDERTFLDVVKILWRLISSAIKKNSFLLAFGAFLLVLGGLSVGLSIYVPTLGAGATVVWIMRLLGSTVGSIGLGTLMEGGKHVWNAITSAIGGDNEASDI